MNVLDLYLIFVKIGAFTFGGGYAMIPLFQDELVVKRPFITPEDFANMVALAQMTPGPVGLNAATYVGYRQLGVPGAIAGTLGVMTPSLILVTLSAAFFLAFRRNRKIQDALSGIRPATLGLIAAAVLFFAEASIFTGPLAKVLHGNFADFGISWQACLIFALVLFSEWKWKPGIVPTIIGAGILGWLLGL